MSDFERDELAALLNTDVDQLYILLAQGDPANAETLFSAAEAMETGRALFHRLSGPLRRRVCGEWKYCARRQEAGLSDTLTLALAVADVVVTVAGGIPAGTIAALMVKRGLTQFCDCRDTNGAQFK